MQKTKIEWCDSTWNPITGCYNDCDYCYARNIVKRFGKANSNHIRDLKEPVYDQSGKRVAYPTGFTPTFHRYKISDYQYKKERTIFVCSMADMFGRWVPDEWIKEVFNQCENTAWHRYLFLTKNPMRYVELADARSLPMADNFYYGTTVTKPTQNFFVGPAYRTFLSIEPILEDFGFIRRLLNSGYDKVDWIIIGAETGNRKNKVIPKCEWIEPIMEVCDKNNIPVFMKDSLVPIVGEENMRREFPWKNP